MNRLQRNLAMTAKARAGYNRCPCCRQAYETDTYTPGVPRPMRLRTKGHNLPQARGGVYWVYVCRQCNTDQGRRTFAQWAQHLNTANDPRATDVAWVANLFTEMCGT